MFDTEQTSRLANLKLKSLHSSVLLLVANTHGNPTSYTVSTYLPLVASTFKYDKQLLPISSRSNFILCYFAILQWFAHTGRSRCNNNGKCLLHPCNPILQQRMPFQITSTNIDHSTKTILQWICRRWCNLERCKCTEQIARGATLCRLYNIWCTKCASIYVGITRPKETKNIHLQPGAIPQPLATRHSYTRESQ